MSDLSQLSKITTRYTNRIDERSTTPINKIKDIKNLVKKDLVSYRGTGAGGNFEISIRNKKVPGYPPSFALLQKDEKKYQDIRSKQFKIKPVAKYFIKGSDLNQLKKFGHVGFLATNRRESVNEKFEMPDNEKRQLKTVIKSFNSKKKEFFGLNSSIVIMAKVLKKNKFTGTARELMNALVALRKAVENVESQHMEESVNEASVSQVRSTLSRVKKQLMKKWAKKGGYENFGQKELRALKSKFKENPYGSPQERQISKMLDTFDNWAMNYSGDMKESVNEGKGVEKVLKMANDHSFGKLGGRTVDALSAGLFKGVYDKASDKNKEKINKMNEKQLYVFMTKLWSKFGNQVRIG